MLLLERSVGGLESACTSCRGERRLIPSLKGCGATIPNCRRGPVAFFVAKAPDAPHQLVAGIDTWSEVTRANPLLDSLSPDVEALLVYKRPDGVECHLVPVATSPVRARAGKARFPTMTG
jgi:hypothetical protein